MSATVSIIICTRNRAESLALTLESIGQTTIPSGWNIDFLIVDNGSSDHTRAVVETARQTNRRLRYLHEPKAGLCTARNSGLKNTTGAIILFTDDDVRVPANWIEAMCRPILNEKADAVAGGIVFPDNIATTLSRTPFSSLGSWFAASEELDPVRPSRMIGANMAFHRRILSQVPYFDLELGPGPGAMGSGDETLFSWQLLAAGYRLAGATDIVVEHHFDVTRLERSHLLTAARNMGRTHAFIFHHWHHDRSRLARTRLTLAKIKRLWFGFLSSPQNKMNDASALKLLRAEQDLAFYREYLVQRRRPRKYTLRGLSPVATNLTA